MAVKNFVEKVTAVMRRKLGVPNQAADLPDGDGLGLVPAVIYAEAGLEVDGVQRQLVSYEEDQLFLLQQGAQVPELQIGAEGSPVAVMQVNMVFTPEPL